MDAAIRGNGELQPDHALDIQALGHAGVAFLPLQQPADFQEITLQQRSGP